MLHEEVEKYRDLSGDTNEHTPISRIGGYLDGYEKGLEVIGDIKAEIERLTIAEGGDDYVRKMAELFSFKAKVLQIIDKNISGKSTAKVSALSQEVKALIKYAEENGVVFEWDRDTV